MASDMLCCQGGTFRHDGCHDKGRTGPGLVSLPPPTCSGGSARAPLARGALRDRYPHVRARHLCAAVRSVGVQPVRRTRCGGSVGGDQRARSQAPPPRAGMVRPPGVASVRRSAPRTRAVGSADSGWHPRRYAARRTQSHRPGGAARRLSHRQQRLEDLELRRQPRRRGQAGHVGQQGHSAAR